MTQRTCHYCGFTADYDSFPDGSAVFLGICACASCLENGKAEDFRQLLEAEEMINNAAFVDELEAING